ncbi:aldose 1-epimerase [Penicillium odoratum]|uniref:aldose 1-epimerase n=1 Tax=Penicillium odoratum TaxID=1167516 RepID=UPI002547ADE3|nr:aldose 1-epimerase [Penicillium odoratum]KAJ5759524.1 aldose 1-epimerase [Penicillium odoratum]
MSLKLLTFLLTVSNALEFPNISTSPLEVYTIQTPNITAKFIPYGARLTSLLVPDRHGDEQDIVLGYDNPAQYIIDTETDHTYFGSVAGRYANRIQNGTFKIDGVEYNVSINRPIDHYTLHGGLVGWDQRNWTVYDNTTSSVTFALYDDAFEGFPGKVISYATYTVSTSSDGLPELTTKVVSQSLTHKTPIMPTNHNYWNLDAFLTSTITDLWLELPLSRRFIGIDKFEIPTGQLYDVASSFNGSADFLQGKPIGKDINKTEGLCGQNCIGYDTCMIIDRPNATSSSEIVSVLNMRSNQTGITMEVMSNQPAIQIYTCNGAGPFPVKPSQIKRNQQKGVTVVNNHGCIAIEPEGWIDGINHPEWEQESEQVFGPMDEPAVNLAVYKFGTVS